MGYNSYLVVLSTDSRSPIVVEDRLRGHSQGPPIRVEGKPWLLRPEKIGTAKDESPTSMDYYFL